MARHFDILSKFTTKLTGLDTSNPREQGKAIDDNIVLLMSMAIKAADLGHCASRWATHLYWSKCLEGEFFAQGDREHEAGVTLSPMMNRNGTSE